MPYIAGHFNLYYAAPSVSAYGSYVSIGSTREGFRLRKTIHDIPVEDDAYGQTPPDTIEAGVEYQVTFDYIEYDTFLAIIGEQIGGFGLEVNSKVGRLGSTYAGHIAAIPLAGTPAATQLGAGKAIIFPLAKMTSDLEFLYSHRLNQGPVTFRCLPDRNSVAHKDQACYVDTAPSVT